MNFLQLVDEESEHRLIDIVLDNIDQGMMLSNEKNEIMYVNKKFTEITGYTINDVRGKTPKIFQSGIQDPSFYQKMKEIIHRHGRWKGQLWNRTKNDDIYLQELEIVALKDRNNIIENFIGIITKLADHQPHTNESLHHLYYDSLTNLPNRQLFEKRLFSTMHALRKQEKNIALIFVQFSQYNQIIERNGKLFADILLKRIAKRVIKIIPENCMLTRWSDETFSCIIEGFEEKEQLVHLIKQCSKTLEDSFVINGIEIHPKFYIGITTFRRHKKTMSRLLGEAIKALNEAKNFNETIVFYDDSMGKVEHHIVTETEITQALENNEFVLYYQPLLETDSGKLVGFEALIRWQHPTEGLIPPNNFIPFAERTGLINDIGKFVFEEACKQQVRWRNKGHDSVLISVNLSMEQFKNKSLVDFVEQTIHKTGADPKFLNIELTESSLMENVEHTILTLKKLSNLGLTIAIDDFGTGYSSLGYLINFPIQIIKIDRSFINALGENRRIEAIIKAINSMARTLNIRVVAEGIESEKQLDLVKNLQCNLAQGFYFDRPQHPDSIEQKWLMKQFFI